WRRSLIDSSNRADVWQCSSRKAASCPSSGGRYSGGPNFDVFLAGHAGEPLDCERKGGEELRVDAAHLTVGLVVQPVVLKNLAVRAARDCFHQLNPPASRSAACRRSGCGSAEARCRSSPACAH